MNGIFVPVVVWGDSLYDPPTLYKRKPKRGYRRFRCFGGDVRLLRLLLSVIDDSTRIV